MQLRDRLSLLAIMVISVSALNCGGGGNGDDSGYSYSANGTYTYSYSEGTLTGNVESSSFPACCGLNDIGGFEENVTVGSATMVMNDDIWSRDNGISGDITGNWDFSDVDGTYSLKFGSDGTFILEGDCFFDGDGSLAISGHICAEDISLDTSNACVELPNTIDDDLEINAIYDNGTIGIEIETPEMLASNTTFDLANDGFKIEIQGKIVEDCYGFEDLEATHGTVNIETYTNDRLKGSFHMLISIPGQITGEDLTGSFDVYY